MKQTIINMYIKNEKGLLLFLNDPPIPRYFTPVCISRGGMAYPTHILMWHSHLLIITLLFLNSFFRRHAGIGVNCKNMKINAKVMCAWSVC